MSQFGGEHSLSVQCCGHYAFSNEDNPQRGEKGGSLLLHGGRFQQQGAELFGHLEQQVRRWHSKGLKEELYNGKRAYACSEHQWGSCFFINLGWH